MISPFSDRLTDVALDDCAMQFTVRAMTDDPTFAWSWRGGSLSPPKEQSLHSLRALLLI